VRKRKNDETEISSRRPDSMVDKIERALQRNRGRKGSKDKVLAVRRPYTKQRT